MKIIKILLLLFLSVNAFSQDMRGICFNRSTSLKNVKAYVSQIIAPGDKVLLNNSKHCVEIIASEKRMDLFDKFISMNFVVTERYGDSSVASGKECLFEIENTKSLDKDTTDYRLSKNSKAKQTQRTRSSKSTSSLRVLESKLAQLYVNDTLITLSCKPRKVVTLIEVSLGSKKTNIITTLEVRKGQRVDLGRVVKNLVDESKGYQVSTGRDSYGASKSNTKGKEIEEFFLTLK